MHDQKLVRAVVNNDQCPAGASKQCRFTHWFILMMGTVNSLQDGHLWDRHQVFVLERCPSYRESNKGSKERQGPTLGVRFTEVSVL